MLVTFCAFTDIIIYYYYSNIIIVIIIIFIIITIIPYLTHHLSPIPTIFVYKNACRFL